MKNRTKNKREVEIKDFTPEYNEVINASDKSVVVEVPMGERMVIIFKNFQCMTIPTFQLNP